MSLPLRLVMYAFFQHYGNLVTQVGQPDTKGVDGQAKVQQKNTATLSTYIDLIRSWQTP